MAYCMYLRKSRKDVEAELSGAGETLARHRATLLELAKKMNIVIAEIYEEVVSGDSIYARPEMQRLLRDVEADRWDGVLVMEVERLARGDTSDQGIVSKTFTYSNTLIITPMKVYDPTDEFDQEYFEFNLFMSRREYKVIKRRLHNGMIAAAKEGKYVHNVPPYGYERVKFVGGKGYTLKPIPEEADIVKLIFTWYTKGVLQSDGTYKRLGTSLICNKLNAEYSQRPKSGVWTVPTLSTMLRNEHYIGMIVVGKTRRKKVMEKGILVDKWENRQFSGDYTLYPGVHPAIIEKSVFEQAQKLLAQNPRRPGIKNITNPLAGVVKCGCCGRSMYRRPYQKRGQTATLICQEKTCHNVSARFDIVENKLLQTLENWIGSYEVKSKPEEPDTSTLDIKQSLFTDAEVVLEEEKGKLTKIYDAFEKGVYDTDTFLERQKMANAKILESERRILNLKEEIENERLLLDNQKHIIPKAKKLLEIYRSSDDVQLKNDLLKEILEKVVYTKTANGHFKDQRQDDFNLDIYPRIPKDLAPVEKH